MPLLKVVTAPQDRGGHRRLGRGEGRSGEDSLYGDTLGPAGSVGATYVDMEKHNTTTIVTALRGSK